MKISSFYEKEVISITDGNKLGEILDIEIDELTGNIVELHVRSGWSLFRLFTKKQNKIIPWSCVKVIGEETILVNFKSTINSNNKQNSKFFKSLVD